MLTGSNFQVAPALFIDHPIHVPISEQLANATGNFNGTSCPWKIQMNNVLETWLAGNMPA
jgi:hypothetical protein